MTKSLLPNILDDFSFCNSVLHLSCSCWNPWYSSETKEADRGGRWEEVESGEGGERTRTKGEGQKMVKLGPFGLKRTYNRCYVNFLIQNLAKSIKLSNLSIYKLLTLSTIDIRLTQQSLFHTPSDPKIIIIWQSFLYSTQIII